MKLITQIGFLPLVVGAFLFTVSAQAQRGGGGFDRESLMERMSERYQEALEVSDDEWSVLKPMVMGIVEKQFSGRGGSRFGGFAGRGGRGGRGGEGDRGNRGDRGDRGNRGPSASDGLSSAIESGSEAKIKSELAKLRADRKKSAKELEKARNELRQLLTLKQEANMVLMGLLD